MSQHEFDEQYRRELKFRLARFERVLREEGNDYFDTSDLEAIIEHYLDEEEYEKAREATEFALRQHPYTTDFLLTRSYVCLMTGEYETAIHVLSGLESLGDRSVELYTYKGDAYIFTGRYRKALYCYKKALPFATDKEEREDIYINLSFIYQSLEKYEAALACARSCLRLNPQSEEAMNEISRCIEYMQQYRKGVRLFEALIDDDPYNPLPWYYAGLCYKALGDYKQAFTAFDYAVIVQPDFEEGYEAMGDTCHTMSRYTDAIRYYQKAAELTDTPEDLYRHIGVCYEALEFFGRARHYYHKAIRHSLLKEFTDELWYMIGCTYAREGKLNTAQYSYEKAISIHDEDARYYLALGDIFARKEELEPAVAFFRKATTLEPLNAATWHQLGLCLFNFGADRQAVKVLHEGLDYLPESALLHLLLGSMYVIQGIPKEGQAWLEEAFDLQPAIRHQLFELFPELEDNTLILQLMDQQST